MRRPWESMEEGGEEGWKGGKDRAHFCFIGLNEGLLLAKRANDGQSSLFERQGGSALALP